MCVRCSLFWDHFTCTNLIRATSVTLNFEICGPSKSARATLAIRSFHDRDSSCYVTSSTRKAYSIQKQSLSRTYFFYMNELIMKWHLISHANIEYHEKLVLCGRPCIHVSPLCGDMLLKKDRRNSVSSEPPSKTVTSVRDWINWVPWLKCHATTSVMKYHDTTAFERHEIPHAWAIRRVDFIVARGQKYVPCVSIQGGEDSWGSLWYRSFFPNEPSSCKSNWREMA